MNINNSFIIKARGARMVGRRYSWMGDHLPVGIASSDSQKTWNSCE